MINAFDMLMKTKQKPHTIKNIHESKYKPEYFVYIDGACINNGKENAQAGFGIYFGVNDERNVSKKVKEKQSNNTAELGALYHLYSIIENDINNKIKIGIVSDSDYTLKCISTYGQKNEDDEWEKDIPNKDLVKKTFELYKDKKNVRFFHIKAHTNNDDIHSIGNREADRLANESLGLIKCPYDKEKEINDSEKIYLQVPYASKNEIKKLGGKWDFGKKKWYIYEDSINKDEVLFIFKVYTF